MGLKERLYQIAREVNIDTNEGCGYHDGLMRAADYAQESDALMQEMAEALEDQKNCDPTDKRDVMWCHKGIVAALDSYSQYKEKTNEQ